MSEDQDRRDKRLGNDDAAGDDVEAHVKNRPASDEGADVEAHVKNRPATEKEEPDVEAHVKNRPMAGDEGEGDDVTAHVKSGKLS
jgi:hypothetical protein